MARHFKKPLLEQKMNMGLGCLVRKRPCLRSLGFRVWGLGFRVQGLGFGVEVPRDPG